MNVVGQTLFLGASVVSFSSNIGWGGRNSSVTVELIEDLQPFGRAPFRKFNQNKSADYSELDLDGNNPLPKNHPGDRELTKNFFDINFYNPASYPDNHYYECSGDDCYIDEKGEPYSTSSTKLEKNVPGKIYYEWVNNRFVSKYWYGEDPGFFATGTRINPDGVYEASLGRDPLASNLYIYDIVNTPVYFKFDNFEFIGLIRNWDRNNRPGGMTYSVTIESFDELLDNCHVILQSFNGAIFNVDNSLSSFDPVANLEKLNNQQIGGPVNFPAPSVSNFNDRIQRGNLPNVFNVYGFLESMGNNGFGGSKLNSEGLRANDILDSVQVLTSSTDFDIRPLDKAFSPFGRILTKNISNARDSSIVKNLKSFGVISVNGPNRTIPNPAPDYNSFRLDLSSLPRPPDNYRIQGNPSLSISQIIRQISDDTGVDFLSVVIPIYSGTSTDFIIKIITVNRTNYNPLYQIPSVVTTLEQNNFKVENSSFGQEKNNNYTRKLVFGGNQQRLYQVKNYRLSYNQNNLIYNPIINKFINTDPSVDKNTVNKIRHPDLSSTRNKIISDFVHPTESDIFLRDDNEKNKRFYDTTNLTSIDSVISDWGDFEVGRAVYVQNASGNFNAEQELIQRGNYRPTLLFKNTATIFGRKNIVVNNQQLSKPVSQRYISLFNDVICPYFGTKADKQVPIGDDSNEFRLPRPVLLDTWTNQITVIFDLNELPILSVGEPLSLYDAGIFDNANNTSVDATSGLPKTNSGLTSGQTATPANATNFGGAASNGIKPTRTLDYKAPGFTVKESEFRCPDWDSYLTYCLGKSIYSKPDLFVMLVNAYKNKGMFLSAAPDPSFGPGGGISRGGIAPPNVATHTTPSTPNTGLRTNLNMNWDLYLNHNFIKDLQILFSFIKNLSDTYYGRKYAIKAPDLYSYKDTQYANLQIPSNLGNISVYQGSNQISYDYEIASGAWEEYGNYIDDSIVCGDNNWQVLRNEDELIPAILGYNNSANIDDVTRLWCELSYSDKIKKLTDQMSSFIEEPDEITKQINQANEALAAYAKGIVFINVKIDQKTTILPEKDILKEMYPRKKFDTAIPKVSLKSYRAKLINKQTQTNKLVIILKEKAREAALDPNNLNRQLADAQKKLRELKNRLKRATGNDAITLGVQIDNAQQKIQDILKKLSLVQQLRTITGSYFDCSDPGDVSIPSIDISNLDNDSYVIIDKNIQNNDAFDRKVHSSKLYLKTNSENIVFLDPINLSDPRIIVDSPGISLASSSYSYLTDPNLTVISNVALEDFNIINNLREETIRYIPGFGNTTIPVLSSNIDASEEQYVKYLLSYVFPIDKNRLVPQGASVNNASQHHMLMPKKATPFFAAVPLKSNRSVYGPWTNYPGLVMNNQLADNLIGNIKIEQNNDYVPWNYGGMSYLDKVVSYSMNVDVNYQNTIETGRVSIIGPPVFGIGGTFSYDHISQLNTYRSSPDYTIYDNNYYNRQTYSIVFLQQSGPNNINSITYNLTKLVEETYGSSALISNISIQTASDGLRTSYSFQTYNPKTGLFNKEISDNIKKQNAQLLKFNKLLFDKANNISNKQLQNINSIVNTAKTSRQPYAISKNKTNLFGTSPVELIIGQAAGYVPFTFGTMTQDKFNEVYRNHHYAGIFPAIEVGSELLGDYDSKAAMSLDGLLSPVSFYPTRLNSTYSISDHSIKDSASNIEPICPRCNNKRLITIDYVDYSKTARPTTELKIACPVCSKTKINHNNKTLSPASVPTNINLYSLNPIIVSDGEFRNPHTGDEEAAPKHSILAVSRGETLPVGEQSFLLSTNTINNNNTDYDENDNNKAAQDATTILMNQRFFALRGPLMLHSWGFDAEGYPIPNANSEPLDIEKDTNRPLRFVLTSDGLNDLSQQGRYEPEINSNGQATKRLGDIITKQYTWDGSKYKFDQKKSVFFHKKWGERPDLWPVGPIDLRWDDKRKVWDASGGGCKEEVLPPFIISDKNDLSTLSEFLENRTDNKCPYKMVYLTLEQDMVKESNFESTNPARAFLDDIEYSKEPLQNNFRRLVYVIDTAGYTAPKGTKLLCRYNRDNGFYEPITKPILTALGTITGVEAKIEMSYTQARRSGVIPPIFTTKFSNPLRLTAGTRGLFNYIDGQWTLISTG